MPEIVKKSSKTRDQFTAILDLILYAVRSMFYSSLGVGNKLKISKDYISKD